MQERPDYVLIDIKQIKIDEVKHNNLYTFANNFLKVIKMNKLKTACLLAAIASSSASFAGGLLTNTNQNIAFNRMMSREASIGIDGVYYNPAGVVFMGEGHHLSINWQLAYQTRTINNDYELFYNNVKSPTTPRDFKGEAFAPVIPSFQYAYNKGRWSFQGNFALTGGGPSNSTTSIGLLVYNYAFSSNQYGYANAIALILFAIIVLVSVLQLKLSSRFEV